MSCYNIEQMKTIEEVQHQKKQALSFHNKENISPRRSQPIKTLATENTRIIKLIRQKLYPLQSSEKPSLKFPKLKERIFLNKTDQKIPLKKYIQIDLTQEKRDPKAKVRTDIEEQLIQKYKLDGLRKSNKIQTSFTTYSNVCKLKKKARKIETLANESGDLKYYSLHDTDDTSISKINQESLLHSHYLSKIKDQLEENKKLFKKKIKITEISQSTPQKEEYNVEYIVHLLDQKKQSIGGRISAYETASPNKLKSYLSILSKKSEKQFKIWEEFQKSERLKEKINEDDMRSKHLIEQAIKKNITMVEDTTDIQQENILSAKYRMKTNHKKLLEMAKNKIKQ